MRIYGERVIIKTISSLLNEACSVIGCRPCYCMLVIAIALLLYGTYVMLS